MRRVGVLAIALGSACFEDPAPLDPGTSTGPGGDGSTQADDDGSTAAGPGSDVSGDAETMPDDDTTAAPDSSSGGPVCGDMNVEGDETCDDGNDVAADGCTECRTSLTPAWVQTYGSDFRGDVALAVSARPNIAVVAGTLEGDGGDADLWLELLDDEGESLGRILVGGAAGSDDVAADARIGLAGEVWATGTLDDGAPAQAQIDVRHLSGDLDVDWAVDAGLDDAPDRGVAIELVSDGAVVGGALGSVTASDAWLGRYDDTGALVWEYECDCGPVGTVVDVAALPMKVRALAIDGTQGALWAFDDLLAMAPTWEVAFDGSVKVGGVAVALGGDTLVCGSQNGGNDEEVWLARYDPSGDEVWTSTEDLGDGDQTCHGLHLGGDTALVVGEIREDINSARGLVARFDFATGDVLDSQELVVGDSADTRVLAVDAVDGVPVVGGAYAVDALDDNAFVARLVP